MLYRLNESILAYTSIVIIVLRIVLESLKKKNVFRKYISPERNKKKKKNPNPVNVSKIFFLNPNKMSNSDHTHCSLYIIICVGNTILHIIMTVMFIYYIRRYTQYCDVDD